MSKSFSFRAVVTKYQLIEPIDIAGGSSMGHSLYQPSISSFIFVSALSNTRQLRESNFNYWFLFGCQGRRTRASEDVDKTVKYVGWCIWVRAARRHIFIIVLLYLNYIKSILPVCVKMTGVLGKWSCKWSPQWRAKPQEKTM